MKVAHEINTHRKVQLGLESGTTGTVLGWGGVITIFQFVTTTVAMGGLGVILDALQTAICLGVFSFLGILVSIPAAIWLYRDYVEAEKNSITLADIQAEMEKEKNLELALETKLFQYAIQLLILIERQPQAVNILYNNAFSKSERELILIFIEKVQQKIEADSIVRDEFEILVKNPCYSTDAFAKHFEKEKTECLYGKIGTKQNGLIQRVSVVHNRINTSIKTGLMGFFAITTGLLGVASPVATMALGLVTTTSILVTSPIIGWSILGVSIVAGLILGSVFAYHKYRTSQQHAEFSTLEINNAAKQNLLDKFKTEKKIINCELKNINNKNQQNIENQNKTLQQENTKLLQILKQQDEKIKRQEEENKRLAELLVQEQMKNKIIQTNQKHQMSKLMFFARHKLGLPSSLRSVKVPVMVKSVS